MKIQEIRKREKNFKEEIIPLLTDEVFHITTDKNYKKILETGYIKNSLSFKSKPTTDYSKNSYFYKRWFISLFDWRKKKWNKWKTLYEELWKYIPYAHQKKYIILILKKNIHFGLKEINYKRVNKKHEIIIPFIEVWYKDKISINDISKTIIIKRQQYKYKKWSLSWLAHNAEKLFKNTPAVIPEIKK